MVSPVVEDAGYEQHGGLTSFARKDLLGTKTSHEQYVGRAIQKSMRQTSNRERTVVSDLVRGALAGVAANWVMGQVTSYLYQHESEEARKKEQEARGGKMAYGVAAEKAAEVAGQTLSEKKRKSVGRKIHWALGAGAGATYSVLRQHGRGVGLGQGLAFGSGFYVLIDEVANPALGLTPGPTAFPWQTHARGLVAHLVFGVATETLLGLME